jgi:type I restriction-modification system DNA methylase subunit
MRLAELLDALDYTAFPQYYLKTDQEHSPDLAPLFRSAKDAGVDGIYVIESSPQKYHILPVRPAVYVAEAQTPEEAREIHRCLWNLGQAPFLIVVLPNQIRVYTGFDYSKESQQVGLLKEDVRPDENSIRTELAEFRAASINAGDLWSKRADDLRSDKRVDKRLLQSLSDLSKYLQKEKGLSSEVAHALIGKYVYIRYLRDRVLLSDQWLEQKNINIERVLSRQATIEGLSTLIEFLDDQLNGSIFPLDLNTATGLTDEVIALVASIFKGDTLVGKLQQLSLDFNIYDFEYIPIETLSSIYELFLHAEGKAKTTGAIYTPEALADYLLAEMHAVKPLKKGMKILDPSCGSGVFLVLTYRRLIEMELAGSSERKLPLAKLLELLKSLYGIERELDACYVTEFSLILTLLNYANVAELLSEKKQLPPLHNRTIFHADFFDDDLPLYEQQLRFDWIIGNPPWIQADAQKDHLALAWIKAHKTEQPVSNKNVAEAFTWRVLDLLEPSGHIGLILPAASLYNLGSKTFRQSFFQACEVLQITNFSNLRQVLFEGRAIAPAVTILYRKASAEAEKPLISHYGPFSINQLPNASGQMWTITLNENEFQTVSPYEAERGDAATWKFALWGTHRDQRAIAQLRRLFPKTLGQLCQENEQNGWHLHEGSQLRICLDGECEGLELLPDLVGKKRLDTVAMSKSKQLFSIPEQALLTIPREECYIRVRGGKTGLLTSEPPHLVMHASWKYVIYSDDYFVIRPRQIGLSAPQKDADYLRALSVFLSSSITGYCLFFQTPSWGIERDRITLDDVKSIPLPHFTPAQIEQLAAVQKELAQMEIEQSTSSTQAFVDEQIAHILQVPARMSILVTEFRRVRSTLIGGSTSGTALKPPTEADLRAYAQEIADELDAFTAPRDTHHKVTITPSQKVICCTVELLKSAQSFPIEVSKEGEDDRPPFPELLNGLNKGSSQWVYIQRGLRIFVGPKVYIYKVPRLINWTRTQARNDSDDLIAEVLGAGMGK